MEKMRTFGYRYPRWREEFGSLKKEIWDSQERRKGSGLFSHSSIGWEASVKVDEPRVFGSKRSHVGLESVGAIQLQPTGGRWVKLWPRITDTPIDFSKVEMPWLLKKGVKAMAGERESSRGEGRHFFMGFDSEQLDSIALPLKFHYLQYEDVEKKTYRPVHKLHWHYKGEKLPYF